jgi:hypothetical protein
MGEKIGEVDFSDSRGSVDGFARGWFFWIHRAARAALDIRFFEAIDSWKTQALRDTEARERGFDSLAAMKAAIKATGKPLASSQDYKAVMARSIQKFVIRQGKPPAYAFREGDSFESRCGNWAIQVVKAKPVDKTEKKKSAVTDGRVDFNLFVLAEPDAPGKWSRHARHAVTQNEFVAILKNGRGGSINLTIPTAHAEMQTPFPPFAPTVDDTQDDLFAL